MPHGFTALANRSVQVTCQTPEQAQLPRWVAARAKQLNLELDDAANQVLCYCYEGNLLALAQALGVYRCSGQTAN